MAQIKVAHPDELLPMKNLRSCTETAKVYRRAAELTDTGFFSSCYAVNEAVIGSPHKDTKEASAYAYLFAPRVNHHPDEAWGLSWDDDWEVMKSCRVLALCFMAAMVEAGDA